MKKLKLTLNKETIAKLNDEKMDGVKGGATWTWFACPPKTAVSECLSCPDKTCTCSIEQETKCCTDGTVCSCFCTAQTAC